MDASDRSVGVSVAGLRSASFDPPSGQFLLARVGLAIGLSFALYPLLMLWSHAIGLSLGSLNAWLPIGVGVVLTIVRLSRLRAGMFRERFRLWICADGFLADVVFIMAIPFLLVTRFLPIRSLPAPMWGDSYQHAVVTQLVIDNGGLFHTWQPYADYSSFTVHYGFSAISAVFAWLTGCDSVSSSLVVGQLANTAAVISVYSLANALFPGSRWVGTLAVIAAGMLSKMPMYYVNWGRYAQLSAQVILPPVLSLLLTQTRLKYPSGKLNLITSICIAGSMLHYYRAPFYLIAFAVALLVLDMFRSGLRKETVLRETVNLLTSGCFAAILTYPRFHASMDSRLSESAGAVISADYELLWKSVVEDYNVWSNVSWFVHPSLLVLSALSIPISLLSKKWRASVGVVATWSVILFLLPMGRLFRIPGLNLMQSFANAIFIYVPVSTLTAMTIDYLLGRCQSYLKKQAVLAFAFLVLILGVPLQIGFVDPKNHALVTHPDVRAMRWIRDYTDSDSVFLVEGFSIYSGSSIVGSDAGWWIPLIARRKNTIPPQYAILNERESEKGLTKSLINLVLTAETSGIQSSQFRLSACRLGVSYLYVGQRQGLVGADVRQMFSYQEARQIGRVVYERDRVLLVSLEDCP